MGGREGERERDSEMPAERLVYAHASFEKQEGRREAHASFEKQEGRREPFASQLAFAASYDSLHAVHQV